MENKGVEVTIKLPEIIPDICELCEEKTGTNPDCFFCYLVDLLRKEEAAQKNLPSK